MTKQNANAHARVERPAIEGDMQGTYIKTGNSKLGRSVGTINRMPEETCPGASEWCEQFCYAQKGRFPMVYKLYRGRTIEATMPDTLPAYVRWHASGDFDTTEYIDYATQVVRDNPTTLFWAYTRSWRIETLRDSLEQLRALPNMQLFASTDPTIVELPPQGWRVASLSDDGRFQASTCMNQTGVKKSCKDCGFCFKGQSKNVKFNLH